MANDQSEIPPLSAEECELLSETPTLPEDVEFLRRKSDLQRTIWKPAIERHQTTFGISPESVEDRARRIVDSVPPDLRRYVTLEKMVMTLREHSSAANELLADYPKKIKKWCLFCAPSHSAQLKNVTFASFRIDEIGACTLTMPSGASAIIVNSSALWLIPSICSAFEELYQDGIATPGSFHVKSSKQMEFIVTLAIAFRHKDYSKLSSIVFDSGIAPHIDSVSWWYAGIFAALHECGHVVLGHSTKGHTDQQLHIQEHEADAFAVSALLDLDQQVSRQYIFNIAMAITVLFGFTYLVSPSYDSRRHPSPTFRWTAVRGLFLEKLGNEVELKRLEFIVEALASNLPYYERKKMNDLDLIRELEANPAVAQMARQLEVALEDPTPLSLTDGHTLQDIWENLSTEIFDLVCTTSAKYAKERALLSVGVRPAVMALTGYLTKSYGLEVASASAMASLALLLPFKMMREAWCKTMKAGIQPTTRAQIAAMKTIPDPRS